MLLKRGFVASEDADCIIAATVLFSYLRVHVCFFSVLVFYFLLLFEDGDLGGLAGRSGLGIFFDFIPTIVCERERDGGKMEAQDVDRT